MTAAARAEEAAAYLLTRADRGTTSGDDDADEAGTNEPIAASFAFAA